MITVAITSVGSAGAQGVIKALRSQQQYPVTLVGVDAQKNVAGRYLVDQFICVPLPHQPGYLETLTGLVTEHGADLLIPIMEREMEVLSAGWPDDLSCRLVCSDHQTVLRCNDKRRLYPFLRSHGFKVPRLYEAGAVVYPAILKPALGGGSRGVQRLDGEADLQYHLPRTRGDVIVQEWIEGDEYSVDTFCDLDGQLVGVVPRLRLEVKGGLATKTRTVREPVLAAEVSRLVRLLEIRGPANVQAIGNRNGFSFTDVNLRFGGASVASVRAGLNGPLYLLSQVAGDPIRYEGYQENLTMLRYWTEVYVDGQGNLL